MTKSKIPILSIIKITFFFIAMALIYNCANRDTINDFCEVQRTFDSNVDNKEGVLIYLQSKDRYAIRYYPNLPTIDEVHLYILCKKPNDLNENESVRFSGKLYKFNVNEGYDSTVGGSEFYFITNLNIYKL